MKTTTSSLTPFFSPTGVAIVGASLDPTKLGYGLSRNLVQSGFRGAIHFVNLKGGILLGRSIHKSISEVPDPVDLAVLLIPAKAIPHSLKECGDRGIQAAIIMAGGFREIGSEGAALEEECLEIARKYDLRLLGPNCIGLIDAHLPLDTTFLSPPGPTPGDVAFISHSGAICAAVIDWARGQGFGLSRMVSLGNQADVNETDVLAPIAADPYTNVLTLYLEGISDGRRFVKEAKKVTRKKPIIAIKVGRFESGQRAVASHTGALAGQEIAFNAAFRRAGVIRVETSEELFDCARALAWCKLPAGRGVGVLTNAGGPGVAAADALESHGLHIVSLAPATQKALRNQLSSAASIQNPVDMLAAATPHQYANCLRILLDDPGVHSAMVILPPPPMHTAGGVAKAVIPVIFSSEKPVVIALMGERLIQEAVEHFRAARVPEYRFPERAAAALSILVKRAEYLTDTIDQESSSPEMPFPVNTKQGITILNEFIQTIANDKHEYLPDDVTSRVLNVYGIPTLPLTLATTPEEAVELAKQAGFPVVLKLASPDISHKSDVGGVLLNLNNASQVIRGFEIITLNVRKKKPKAKIHGIHVQRMLPEGQEVIIGVIQDPQFGPLVMFGSGGIEVERLKDVEFALAPLSRKEASRLIEDTWAGKKLRGYRNIPAMDHKSVLDALLRLSQLAIDLPTIAEIEINPMRVLANGQGAFAVDVRARLRKLNNPL